MLIVAEGRPVNDSTERRGLSCTVLLQNVHVKGQQDVLTTLEGVVVFIEIYGTN